MAYSDNFPATRPVFMADFANGGKIDPRATFSRASTGTFFGTDKVLSSENLVDYSGDISQSSWTKEGVTAAGSQTAPDGGTDAYKLTEDSATSHHRIYKQVVTDGSAITFSGYFKYIGRQWVRIRLTDSSAVDRYVWFDIQNGAVGTAQTGFSGATITASGNGYYKVSVTLSTSHVGGVKYLVIAGIGADNSTSTYAGSGADAFAVWGVQVSSIGETVLNETSGSIHREYQTKLQTAASGAARFEHSATDGQSAAKGILVEGQSTNAVGYSDSLASWNQSRLTATNASAVGPTGSLNAALLTPSTDAGFEHIIYATSVTTSVTGTVTLSGYFKAAGYDYATLGIGNTATGNFSHALFNLSTGAYVTNNSGGSNSYVSSSTESVGNGWWRLVATFSTSRSNEQFVIGPASTSSPTYDSNWGTPTYTGDGYSSVLATGIQAEIGKSFASSLITSNSGSETTRAAESLSVDTSSFYTGGPFSFGADFRLNGKNSTANGVAAVKDSSSNSLIINVGSDNLKAFADVAAATTIDSVIKADVSANTDYSVFARWDTNDYKGAADGTLGNADTVCPLPDFNSPALHIGGYLTNYELNGHVKRVALYNEALSDTNLQALTS